MRWIYGLALALYFPAVAAQITIIKIPRPGSFEISSPGYYPEALLLLTLEKTRFIYGAFEVVYVDEFHSADRLRAMLIGNNGLDVMWSSVTKDRREYMRALDYDIFQGLHSYHVLLIRGEDKEIFRKINSLEQLKKFKAGVGSQWSDKLIFSHNKLAVVSGGNLSSLNKMLVAKRFDYLPRGIYEYGYELHNFNKTLVISDHLILYYCQPVNFFINKNNVLLGNRILLGLTLAQADGSLDRLFQSMPNIVNAQKELIQFSGITLKLENPDCYLD